MSLLIINVAPVLPVESDQGVGLTVPVFGETPDVRGDA
jgi:hypothetical protein